MEISIFYNEIWPQFYVNDEKEMPDRPLKGQGKPCPSPAFLRTLIAMPATPV